jgi:hypothetical protein
MKSEPAAKPPQIAMQYISHLNNSVWQKRDPPRYLHIWFRRSINTGARTSSSHSTRLVSSTSGYAPSQLSTPAIKANMPPWATQCVACGPLPDRTGIPSFDSPTCWPVVTPRPPRSHHGNTTPLSPIPTVDCSGQIADCADVLLVPIWWWIPPTTQGPQPREVGTIHAARGPAPEMRSDICVSP